MVVLIQKVERAFELAKAEHEQEQAQRARAHEEAYRAAVETREGRVALLKARQGFCVGVGDACVASNNG